MGSAAGGAGGGRLAGLPGVSGAAARGPAAGAGRGAVPADAGFTTTGAGGGEDLGAPGPLAGRISGAEPRLGADEGLGNAGELVGFAAGGRGGRVAEEGVAARGTWAATGILAASCGGPGGFEAAGVADTAAGGMLGSLAGVTGVGLRAIGGAAELELSRGGGGGGGGAGRAGAADAGAEDGLLAGTCAGGRGAFGSSAMVRPTCNPAQKLRRAHAFTRLRPQNPRLNVGRRRACPVRRFAEPAGWPHWPGGWPRCRLRSGRWKG
jgi:hypothetical protein